MRPTGAAILGTGPAGASVLGGGPSAPGGSAFDPSQELSVVRWWRADTVILDGGGKVVSVTDKSSAADPFMQVNVTGTYNATDARYGGKPSVEVVGATTFFHSTSTVTTGAFTIFWVGLSSAVASIWSFGPSSDYVRTSNDTTSHEVVRAGGNCFKTTTAANWGVSAAAQTFTTVYGGTLATFTQGLNGVAVPMTNLGVDGGTTPKAQTFEVNTNGSFAEVIICNAALSAARVAQFEAYLRARYTHY